MNNWYDFLRRVKNQIVENILLLIEKREWIIISDTTLWKNLSNTTKFQVNSGHTIFYIWNCMFTIITKTRVLHYIKGIPLYSISFLMTCQVKPHKVYTEFTCEELCVSSLLLLCCCHIGCASAVVCISNTGKMQMSAN